MKEDKPNKDTQTEKTFFNNKDETPDPGAGQSSSPKDGPGAARGGGDSASKKKVSVTLRHKTEYPRYRRAGLVLTQKPETYEVTEEQLAALKKDKWVEIGKEGDGKK